MRASFQEIQHAINWTDRHNSEMSLALALQRAGYTRDQSRRMVEAHRRGEPLQLGDNGGPPLDPA